MDVSMLRTNNSGHINVVRGAPLCTALQ